MKIALVTTTINVPDVLRLYRAADSDVHFFIIGDRKTPDEAVVALLDGIPNHSYYGIDFQNKLGYASLAFTPENCIQRRNIGFLEALKWGADIVVSIDDDNIPVGTNYFDDLKQHFWPRSNFDGIEISGKDDWFDVGQYLRPVSPHRGFPIQHKHDPVYRAIVGAKVGVAAGICLGDPDISAVTRIACAPDVQDVSLLLKAGLVVAKDTHTVFNSQNTAVIRELMPAWAMIPHVGRMDDIYASLIVQRIMKDRDLHVHFGPPFVVQQRNAHDLVKDLRGEVEGMQRVSDLANLLDHVMLPNKSVIDDCRIIWDTIRAAGWMPLESVMAMYAWLTDCETLGM